MEGSFVPYFVLYFALLFLLTPPLAHFMSRVFRSDHHPADRFLGGMERAIYRTAGIDPQREMSVREYGWCLALLNGAGLLLVLALQLVQNYLPLNPAHQAAVSFLLALNTAVSFATNTNWQAYSGEVTLSPLTQSFGLTVLNFLSAATGLTVLLVLIRSFVLERATTVGNFWQDLVRTIVYLFIPLSLLLALLLAGQGVVQSWNAGVTAVPPRGDPQFIPLGPVASQVAIKQLGTNGGGFFGTNSAHPFENPTLLSSLLEMLAILLIPSSQVLMFGRMIGAKRQGWTLWMVMLFLLLAGLAIALVDAGKPFAACDQQASLEGIEMRFGIGHSVLWSVLTTSASNGSVNAMLGSSAPLTGGIGMLNIMLGEVIFGGVGVGLTGMLIFVLITVFIAGLMTGRTPEYLGKKIDAFEIKMAMIVMLAPIFLILVGSALAVASKAGLASRSIAGPHGLSEILYAFSSAAGNNGSAFAGLNANTPFYNGTLALSMLLGRAAAIFPILAMAGKLAAKPKMAESAGTLKTDTLLFAGLLIGVIAIIGVLTFFPALSLGPLLEHALVKVGTTF
ncbi:MAG TPA: potassium-transporting ATPase subunit KdpA [bacterium]|nr:potassium-transporting ATPase subunit KdpA [bacterium]HQG45113.1 potassium-transporting ATPase subunit KdpA [bacterium]HQI47356.1 potassium-transporting ATPase subunit KdpA [bacterium]HQJ63042.1 potassium-transporting ATPase subunit KdpA [bacterium]